MSKIFEALKRAGGEFGEIALPWLGEAPPVRTEVDPPPPSPQDAFEVCSPVGSGQPPRTCPLRIPAGEPLLPFDGGHTRPSEQYRIIRTKIVQHPDQPRVLAVSSPGAGDGKTVTAVNLAGALALRKDVKVLLVDADFRRSRIANVLGLPAEPGLIDVLSGKCPIEDAIVCTEQFPNLHVVPAGKLDRTDGVLLNPAELLDAPRWKAVCSFFKAAYRFTIVDTPPLAAVADCDLIQEFCDGVILVVRADHTNRTLCHQALQALPGKKLTGVIMNGAQEWFLRRSRDYAYSGHLGLETGE